MTREPQRAEEAARWVNRLDQPAIDTSASAAFDAWMAADKGNRDDFADLQALWHSDVLIQALGETAASSGAVAGERPGRIRRGRAGWWLAGAGACAASLALVLGVPPLVTTTYRTGVGNGRAIELADGSHVELSGDAELRVRILPWVRTATLERGEAFFDVRHERWRRFEVHSGATAVRVLGTAFNVDRQSPTRTAVEVFRGAVALEARGDADIVLRKGERARVIGDHISTQTAATLVKMGDRPDWTSGWFEAADVPMNVLLAKAQRHSPRPIRLVDPAIGAMPVSGRFHVSDPGRVLQAIRAAYDLEVRYERDAIVVAHSLPPSGS